MRVCMVGLETLPLPPVLGGAIERGMMEVMSFLAKRGVELHVISISNEKITNDVLKKYNFAEFHYVKIPTLINRYPLNRLLKGFYFFKDAAEIINKIEPDVVHFRNYPAAVYVVSRYLNKKYPIVINFHNMDYGWNFFAKRLDRFLFSKGFKEASYFIAVSDFIKNHILEKYSKDVNGRIATIHNGVNIDIFKPKDKNFMRKTLGIGEEPLLIFAGRIDPRKGLDVLLDAFTEAKQTIKNLKLVIIGPMGSFWHKKPQEFSLHIKKRIESIQGVYLLEPTYDREKLSYIYSMADVACIPSIFPEGLPLTALEMQACGVPVLATDAGGLKEAYIDGETGFFVQQGNVSDLADKIKKIFSNDEIRRKMGIKARKFVEENFTWEITADKLMEVYKTLLKNG